MDNKRLKVGFNSPKECYFVYGKDGKLWPRLVLTAQMYSDGFSVHLNLKTSPKHWWECIEKIPIEFVDDMLILVNRMKSRIDNGIENDWIDKGN